MPTLHPARRRALAAIAGVAAALTFAGTASAKEVGSGGTPAATACAPVSSLSTRGDARAGETGLATIDISYAVKPCDTTRPVTVTVTLAETAAPAAVAYFDAAAPSSARITVPGIRVRVSYTATVTVHDAATGAVVGSASAFAGATPRGV